MSWFRRRDRDPHPGTFDNPPPKTTTISPELLGLLPTTRPLTDAQRAALAAHGHDPNGQAPCRCGPDCCCRRPR